MQHNTTALSKVQQTHAGVYILLVRVVSLNLNGFHGLCINSSFIFKMRNVLIEADKTDKIIQYIKDVFDKFVNMIEKITE